MVKLLPLHHPVQILEDMCVADQLTGGRLDFGVGRGVAPVEHAWFGSDWRESRQRFEDTLGIICNALTTGEISSANSAYYDFPTAPLSTKPFQNPIPFWTREPGDRRPSRMNLMWPGPIDRPPTTPTSRRGARTKATRCESTVRTPDHASAAR